MEGTWMETAQMCKKVPQEKTGGTHNKEHTRNRTPDSINQLNLRKILITGWIEGLVTEEKGRLAALGEAEHGVCWSH